MINIQLTAVKYKIQVQEYQVTKNVLPKDILTESAILVTQLSSSFMRQANCANITKKQK